MNYYYLIATLPNLSLEETRFKIDFEATLTTIRRNLEAEDELLFRYLIYPNDHKNLLGAIFRQYQDTARNLFVEPAIFDRSEIEEYPRQPHDFPEYLGDFVREFQDRFSELKRSEVEAQLARKFYHEVDQLDDDFIRAYFAFDRVLRSMIAGFNRALYPYNQEVELAELDHISGQLTQEGAGAAILARSYPFIEALREAIDTKDPNRIEPVLWEIRWEFVESYAADFFSRQQVYGYVVKLLMVKRLTDLRVQRREKHLDRLVGQIKRTLQPLERKEL